ncbi:MAG: MMPL family transporter, partial [Haloferacaceae archaeon]
MSRGRWDYEPVLSAVNYWITERPRAVVLAFLLLTGVFAVGLANIEFDAGTGAFTDDVPEQEALDRIDREFEGSFDDGDATTQLVQRGENVLSKGGVLRMLELQQRIQREPGLRVTDTSSPAQGIADELADDAETLEERKRAVEEATPAEVRGAARTYLRENPEATRSLSDDYNEREVSASASIGVVDHAIPADDDGAELRIQREIESMAGSVGGDVVVFGSGIFDAEFERALVDSLSIMIPAVSVLILLFLTVAYRDPVDLLLGLVSLFMAVVWTFGFTGLAGIEFNQMMVAVPPLLLAAGIDFGIHAVNRYREERVEGRGIHEGMRAASNQLLVAFFIVTGTTGIGFGANVTSDLGPIQEFGVVASIGIVFTFLVFGVFMPAAKVLLDDVREETGFPEFGNQPLGAEDSRLGRILPLGAVAGRKAPVAMLVVLLVATAGMGVLATDVETKFDDEDFLPYEEMPAYIDAIPEPLGPGDYTVTGTVNFLSDNFETGEDDEVTVYAEGPLREPYALESIHRAGRDPPPSFVADGERASARSIVTVIQRRAREDEEFGALVEENDLNDNDVPDRNLGEIYDALLSSPAREEALNYITEDRSATRVVYAVEADAGQEAVTRDARSVAVDYRLNAIATGNVVVFQALTELLFESAVVSLAVALGVTGVFLVVVYAVLEGRPSLGIANLAPIVVTVAFLAGTMPILDIPFNALTATVLSITIGIGVDYSVHVTHRFIDEYNRDPDTYAALVTTLRGAGGGITGSVVTTAGGVGSLLLAVSPMLGQFGLLMAVSVIYSYLAALIVLPPTLFVWERHFA